MSNPKPELEDLFKQDRNEIERVNSDSDDLQKAAERATSQAQMKDIFSLTFGNLFDFFSALLLPILGTKGSKSNASKNDR